MVEYILSKERNATCEKYNLLQIFNFILNIEISITLHWNLFHQVRNEGAFFTTLEFISPGNLQEQISLAVLHACVIWTLWTLM
jgi:hypothetical protein